MPEACKATFAAALQGIMQAKESGLNQRLGYLIWDTLAYAATQRHGTLQKAWEFLDAHFAGLAGFKGSVSELQSYIGTATAQEERHALFGNP